MAASQAPEVPSTENIAVDGLLAHQLNTSVCRVRHRLQCRLPRPPSDQASGNTYILPYLTAPAAVRTVTVVEVPPRFGGALQALCHPPRQQQHVGIYAGEVDAIRPQIFHQGTPSLPRHPGRRFDPPSTTLRSAQDHRPPLSSRLGRANYDDVRGTLAGTLSPILGARNGPPALLPRPCSTGRAVRTITTKSTVCTSGCEKVLHNRNFIYERRASFEAWLWLRPARGLASPQRHHGASERCPPLVQGRRRFVSGTRDNQREYDYGWGIFHDFFWMTWYRSSFLSPQDAAYTIPTGAVRGY